MSFCFLPRADIVITTGTSPRTRLLTASSPSLDRPDLLSTALNLIGGCLNCFEPKICCQLSLAGIPFMTTPPSAPTDFSLTLILIVPPSTDRSPNIFLLFMSMRRRLPFKAISLNFRLSFRGICMLTTPFSLPPILLIARPVRRWALIAGWSRNRIRSWASPARRKLTSDSGSVIRRSEIV